MSKYRINVLLLATSRSSYLWKLHHIPERKNKNHIEGSSKARAENPEARTIP